MSRAEVDKLRCEGWALVFYGNPANYRRDQVVPNGAYVRWARKVDTEGGEQACRLVIASTASSS